MKKLIAMLLALTLVVSLAACGGNTAPENETTTTPTTETPETTNGTEAPETTAGADETTAPSVAGNGALTILETVWNATAEESKFMAMGGSMAAPVNGAPGVVEITDTDMLTGTLQVPADLLGSITEAASLMNGMMLNNFTSGAFRVTGDVAAFAAALRNGIQSTQWMCGFPEQLVVYTVGEYVVYAFGLGDFVNGFNTAMTASYTDAVMVYNEAISE